MDLRREARLAVLLLAACGGKDGGAEPSASATATTASGGPRVDARVDALARAVLPCKAWETGFDSICPAFKAWSEAKDSFVGGKADASLVAMIGDGDEKIRYLGAYKLNQYGKAFKTDKALAGAILGAAEREKSRFSGYELGACVGRILARETGTFDRTRAMVEKHDVPDLRRGILSQLLYANADYEPVYVLVRDTVKDTDKAVALAALSSFWTGGFREIDATCQIYADNADNGNDELAAEASNALSWYGKCASRYDGLLDSLEKRIKTGPAALGSTSYVTAARHVCEDAKATDKQKKRADEIGRGIAGNKELKAWLRAAALDTVMKCESGGAAFVSKFRQDPEKSVADKAKELVAKK